MSELLGGNEVSELGPDDEVDVHSQGAGRKTVSLVQAGTEDVLPKQPGPHAVMVAVVVTVTVRW